jgi:hypothetical protein
MTIRCDHCRGSLGLIIHRYWRMRFCSAACKDAYQQRLNDVTKAKIRRLDGAAPDQPPVNERRFGSRTGPGVTRQFAA